MKFDLKTKTKEISNFCKKHHIRRCAFFGSVLTKEFSHKSDIDVLVEFEHGHIPGLAFFEMEDELSEMFDRKVDLNTPKFLSRYFREEVKKQSWTIYETA